MLVRSRIFTARVRKLILGNRVTELHTVHTLGKWCEKNMICIYIMPMESMSKMYKNNKQTDEWMNEWHEMKYKPSPMRRLIFFKTFILLFMGENELSSLQWHFLSLIQQLFNFLSFLSCFNDLSPLKPIRNLCTKCVRWVLLLLLLFFSSAKSAATLLFSIVIRFLLLV